MRKLLKYRNGDEYIIGGMTSIEPNGVEPIEEYDLSDLTEDEFKRFKENKKDKNLRVKIRKIHG